MPLSSCDHRTLLPSGPPDGVRQCSLEGSASRSSLPATSPSESVRSWWCRRSCLLPSAVGGVQPHGCWHPSTIQLKGFSSCSLAAVPRWRSPRKMTTSLVVGRSKPGCGLSPTLSFKDVHHPRWGGRRVEPGTYPPYGLVTRFFLQHSEEKGVHQSCGGGGGTLATRGRPTAGYQLQLVWPFGAGWLWCRLRRCLLPSSRGVVAQPPHGRQSRRARVCHIHGFPCPPGALGDRTRCRTPRRWRRRSWMVFVGTCFPVQDDPTGGGCSNANRVFARDGNSSVNLASQGHCAGVFIGI
jgi:hypothetical protein